MKRLLFGLTLTILPLIVFSQNGRYDVRLNLNSYDCNTQQLLLDIDVKASSADSTFRIAEQNYRFSYNSDAIDTLSIAQEGTLSGFINHGGGTLGFSLYSVHNIDGTNDKEISYNIALLGGDGLFIDEIEWVNAGTLVLNISDIDAPLGLEWLIQSDFPPTFISEKSAIGISILSEGDYVNNITFDTFGDICRCPLDEVTLESQQEVNDFAVNYPDCAELRENLIIGADEVTNIADLSPLNNMNAIGGYLMIDNTILESLTGLENLAAINGKLVIEDNYDLTDITAIKDIDHTTISELRIFNNESLAVCNITSICNYFRDNDTADIEGNAAGCSNDTEVIQDCALPVELLSLKAYIEGKNAIIHWQTATETNNKGFDIQKSSDGISWESIAWQSGQGNSHSLHEYSHKDSQPFFGKSYYRLKQIDFDGKYTHSKIVEINYAGASISIYPNPVKDVLHLSDFNDNIIQNIQIYDQRGREMNAVFSDYQIDISAYAAGIYILRITTQNGVLHQNFLVK